ncbi:hypothetical protein BCR37DRAFT_400096 [Protomyces lactucae-debilis]|uniref:Shugoshin C-terminal domain-containing protein n=1 Tax=Protomyces lactucae-debilis TaxID=2754530 RepID=A0A1Y2F6J0_PROLT|nr:uncharacterized protein BCR37DRAFT_400096 [Protomyces lactucae-debilis]ORY79104.1 hypothetical protein BCR37DRAFT_400096 [Protomyces lactucae-debilis]
MSAAMDKAALEKQHLKQNREIIRINHLQANRITALEQQLQRIMAENLDLHSRLIAGDVKARQASQLHAAMERYAKDLYKAAKAGSALFSTAAASTPAPASTKLESPVTASTRKLLSAGPVAPPSPSPGQHMKRSPKKNNLLSVSPERIEGFPGAASVSRAAGLATVQQPVNEEAAWSADSEEQADLEAAQQREAALLAAATEREEERGRDMEREARRAARRQHRTSGDTAALVQPVDSRRAEQSVESRERAQQRARRKSHSLSSTLLQDDAEKENRADSVGRLDPLAERMAQLHVSPRKKARPALQILSDPSVPDARANRLPMPALCSPKKNQSLRQVPEGFVKAEPCSPQMLVMPRSEDDLGSDEGTGRSRRGKAVNYAEPSLRAKMRRTESLPGDKRRKSTYRRSSASSAEMMQRATAAGKECISIDED